MKKLITIYADARDTVPFLTGRCDKTMDINSLFKLALEYGSTLGIDTNKKLTELGSEEKDQFFDDYWLRVWHKEAMVSKLPIMVNYSAHPTGSKAYIYSMYKQHCVEVGISFEKWLVSEGHIEPIDIEYLYFDEINY